MGDSDDRAGDLSSVKYRGAGKFLWDSGGGGNVGVLMIPISGVRGGIGDETLFEIRWNAVLGDCALHRVSLPTQEMCLTKGSELFSSRVFRRVSF